MNHRLLPTIILCLLIPWSIAHAQPVAPQTDCAGNPACFALSEQAKQQAVSGQLSEALRSYKLAYEIQADPRLLYSIARVMHVQGQEAAAVPYYRCFIESNLDDEAQKSKAQEYLAQCESIAAAALVKKDAEQRKKLEDERSKTDLLLKAKSTPLYKKAWFWIVVGGVTAAMAVGTAIGVSAREPDLTDVMQYRPFAR